jgi:hypothetical protein
LTLSPRPCEACEPLRREAVNAPTETRQTDTRELFIFVHRRVLQSIVRQHEPSPPRHSGFRRARPIAQRAHGPEALRPLHRFRRVAWSLWPVLKILVAAPIQAFRTFDICASPCFGRKMDSQPASHNLLSLSTNVTKCEYMVSKCNKPTKAGWVTLLGFTWQYRSPEQYVRPRIDRPPGCSPRSDNT